MSTESPEQGLTKWANEPTVEDLHQNIKDAQSDYDRHVNDVDNWLENMFVKEVKTSDKSQSKVAPKVIRKQAEWRYAPLSEPFLSTPDVFNVYPKTAGDKARAEQNEAVLNYQFNHKIDKVSFMDDYVRDVVDTGSVIVKVAWDSEQETVSTEIPLYEYETVMDPALQERYMMLAQMQQENPEQYADHSTPGLDEVLQIFMTTGITLIPHQTGVEETEETKETKNDPTLEICHYKNVIIDPSCNGDLAKATFVGERWKTSLSELRKDGKYTNLDKINIESSSPLANADYEESPDNESFNFTDNPRKQFIVHTYWGEWDIDGSGMARSIVASWVGNIFIRLEENPYPDRKPPFVIVPYMPVRGSVYGEPDGELLESNQDIIGAVTRGVIDVMGKSANGQTGIRKDMLDTTNMRKFKRGEDYEFNATVDPRQGFYSHVYPEIPQAAYNMITMQNAEAESLTGIKAFSSGISGDSLGKVATGVRGVLDATSKRELSILRRLAAGLIKIGHKIISMNAVFLSETETIRITDSEFIQIRRDDLAGEFDLQLAISTAEEDNRKAEELSFMLQTTGNNMDPLLHKMILSEIAKLRKMPALAERIIEFEPQPDPIAQAKAQLEIQLLQAQITKEQTAAEKNHAAAALDMARVGKESSQAGLNASKTSTEKAKVREITSNADKQDLDFIEQESGVKQERDLEQLHLKHSHAIAQARHGAEVDVAGKVLDKVLP